MPLEARILGQVGDGVELAGGLLLQIGERLRVEQRRVDLVGEQRGFAVVRALDELRLQPAWTSAEQLALTQKLA